MSQITLTKGKIESVENIEDTYVSIEPVSTLARSTSSSMYVLNMGIYNGKDGKDGANAPIINVKQEGGVYYWTITVDGKTEWLTDEDGNKLRVSGEDGEGAFGCGATGADNSGAFEQPVFGIQRRKISSSIDETDTNSVGNYEYDVPMIGDKETLARKNGIGGSVSMNRI